MRSMMRRRLIPIVVLAIVLMLGLSATAFAATPGNNGAGQTYAQCLSKCAQQGMLGAACNAGMHLGITGWTCTM